MPRLEHRSRKRAVFLDVDQTLLGDDGSLRPHARELLERLRALRFKIYVWSAVGSRRADLEKHALWQYVDASFKKPFPVEGRPGVVLYTRLRRRLAQGICIDDDPEVIRAFGGILVKAYRFADPKDEGLLDALNAVEGGSWRHPIPGARLIPWRTFLPRLTAVGAAFTASVFGLVQLLLPASIAIQPLLRPATAQAALINQCTDHDWGGSNVTVDTTNSKMGGNQYGIAIFTVNSGITLNVCNTDNGDAAGDGTLTVGATSFVITGTISGAGRGGAGGTAGSNAAGTAGTGGCVSTIETCPSGNGGGGGGGIHASATTVACGGGGGGYVGAGAGGNANQSTNTCTGGAGGGVYGNASTDTLVQEGSGGGGGGEKDPGGFGPIGGVGGAGGARVRLITSSFASSARSITGAGTINVSGAAGATATAGGGGSGQAGGGGGGGGGGIYFRANTVNFTGTQNVAGGNGGDAIRVGTARAASGGGGGSGGRIKCHGVTITSCTTTSTRTAGAAGAGVANGGGNSGGTAGAGTDGTTSNTTAATPTAVTLASLEAALGSDKALIAWQSKSELNVLGYDVIVFLPDGNRRRLNTAPIPAKNPGGVSGAAYAFPDPAPLPGALYYVVEFHTDGSSEPYGPIPLP